ncbi:MAG: winged helix DNA-binding domain-containing protein, partial [Blastocatellia bacterium]|nr:winged helix DNA-binding domain-containing protein [Blastocatellia bacterium]
MKNSIKQSQVSAFRLRRHHLAGHNQTNIASVCQSVCGIQAQVMSAAEMQFWARMPGLTRAHIYSMLLENRTLVKTSCMRGTLHLLPVADFQIYMTALKRSRLREMMRVMSRYGDVTPKEADRVTEAVVEALSSGLMTRRELTERVLSLNIVGRKAKVWLEEGWWGVARQAIVEGLICYGPDRGNETTLVRLDRWLPRQKEVSEMEAQQTLLRRYLGAYGPATLKDFSRWTGIPMKEVKPVWESLEDELVEVSIEDKKGSLLREDYADLKNSFPEGRTLRLLPYFDPYLLGHADKDHLVSSADYKRVYRNAGWISPVVLLDGKIIGTWSYKRRAKSVSLEVEPFEKFSKIVRARIE